MVPSASLWPIFKPTVWLIMMVWANQLVRSSGPSTVSLKSFCALIWSSQLIGGIGRSAPRPAVLKASVTSASVRNPLPDVTWPSRMAYQRPISSSRALIWATRLRSFNRARNAGNRHAAYLRSCPSPHRMSENFIACMVSSCPALRRYRAVPKRDIFRPFGAVRNIKAPSLPAGGFLLISAWSSVSLGLQAGRFHHPRPLLDILAQIGIELGGAHHQRDGPLLVPGLLHVGAIDRLVDLGIELVDDRLGRAGGRHDADPNGRFVAWNAGFRDGGHVRQHRRALAGGGAERAHLAGLDVRRHGGDGVKSHLHMAADDAVAHFAGRLMRHVNQVGAAHGFEQLAGHVIGRAGAGRGIVELPGLRLRVGDEFLEILRRHRGMDHHHEVGIIDPR